MYPKINTYLDFFYKSQYDKIFLLAYQSKEPGKVENAILITPERKSYEYDRSTLFRIKKSGLLDNELDNITIQQVLKLEKNNLKYNIESKAINSCLINKKNKKKFWNFNSSRDSTLIIEKNDDLKLKKNFPNENETKNCNNYSNNKENLLIETSYRKHDYYFQELHNPKHIEYDLLAKIYLGHVSDSSRLALIMRSIPINNFEKSFDDETWIKMALIRLDTEGIVDFIVLEDKISDELNFQAREDLSTKNFEKDFNKLKSQAENMSKIEKENLDRLVKKYKLKKMNKDVSLAYKDAKINRLSRDFLISKKRILYWNELNIFIKLFVALKISSYEYVQPASFNEKVSNWANVPTYDYFKKKLKS